MAIGAVINAYEAYHKPTGVEDWRVKADLIGSRLSEVGRKVMSVEPGCWIPSLKMGRKNLIRFLNDLPQINKDLTKCLIEDKEKTMMKVEQILKGGEDTLSEESQARVIYVFKEMLDVIVDIRLSSVQMSDVLLSDQLTVVKPVIEIKIASKLSQQRNVELEVQLVKQFTSDREIYQILTNNLQLSEFSGVDSVKLNPQCREGVPGGWGVGTPLLASAGKN